jgi:uncharacterized repeat protein (TIGR01451 family)
MRSCRAAIVIIVALIAVAIQGIPPAQPQQLEGASFGWGANGSGQLGDGTSGIDNASDIPVRLRNLRDVIIAVETGGAHTLGLHIDGTAWAWGSNTAGQLGSGDNTERHEAQQVGGLADVIGISAGGGEHSLAVKSDGTVWAWGRNSSGELGTGNNSNSNVPVRVAGVTNVASVSAGSAYSLAVKTDGTVWAWGDNDGGRLGIGGSANSNVPVQVQGLAGVISIAAGGLHSLALKSDGTVFAWGRNNRGQLGNGSTTSSSGPIQVSGLVDVVAIAAGFQFSLAVRSDGTVWAWGDNDDGQLGSGTNNDAHIPVQVIDIDGIRRVAAGNDHSVALKADGTVWAWGNNFCGALGNGTRSTSNVRVRVNDLSGALSVSAGGCQSFAVVGPILGVSPVAIDFPEAFVGPTPATRRQVTLTNTGLADLTVTLSISGPHASDFMVNRQRCTIQPRATCLLSVEFRPRAVGVRHATLIIESNAFDGPHAVLLSGPAVKAKSDLTISKGANLDTVNSGANLIYTVIVTNGGPAIATSGAVMNDILSSLTTFVSVSAPSGVNCLTPAVGASGAVSCRLDPIHVHNPGTTPHIVNIEVRVTAPEGSVLLTTATITPDEFTFDDNLSNNSASITTRIAP